MSPACFSGTVWAPTGMFEPPTTFALSRLAWMLPVTCVSVKSHHRLVTSRRISCSPPSRFVTRTVALTSWPLVPPFGAPPDSAWIETFSSPSRLWLPLSGELSVALTRSLMPTREPDVVVPSHENFRSTSPWPAPLSTVIAVK